MPRFDIPGRAGPVTVTLGHDHRERDMALPYTTDDPREIKRLLEVGCVETGDSIAQSFAEGLEAALPTIHAAAESAAKLVAPKPPKPRKEVTE